MWVYWKSGVHADVSRVRDISAGGLFLELQQPRTKGETLDLHFLVQEGVLRAQAIVRRCLRGDGLVLKFIAIDRDCGHRLADMLARLRGIEQLD